MKLSLVVSDTSPIRALAHLGLLRLLDALFGQTLVPPAVARELTDPTAALPPFDLSSAPFIQVRSPTDTARVQQLKMLLDRTIRPLIDRLQDEIGFFISAELRHLVLQTAGE